MIPKNFAVDLASAASTMMTIAIAILAFLADRTRAHSRTQLGGYAGSLVGLMVLSVYTAASDAIAWWAWTRAGEMHPELLFGWRIGVWLFVLFLPPLLFSGCVFAVSFALLGRQAVQGHLQATRDRPGQGSNKTEPRGLTAAGF